MFLMHPSQKYVTVRRYLSIYYRIDSVQTIRMDFVIYERTYVVFTESGVIMSPAAYSGDAVEMMMATTPLHVPAPVANYTRRRLPVDIEFIDLTYTVPQGRKGKYQNIWLSIYAVVCGVSYVKFVIKR